MFARGKFELPLFASASVGPSGYHSLSEQNRHRSLPKAEKRGINIKKKKKKE